ncbi:hypothetical protein AC791_11960 [Klebsiella sp. RIT-PI-d]|uniref:hypothetical protein n=1 Tax=Klebsiella sp. RIT-PI-d TaxID=1681196 RepID=UPI000675CA98|nr:hypothetical protein [Klebsiella sp. RIT-PI-d]KNC09363.1 hypothetical protein AC791_11960 [Klebsiella sp. RIT-PI-d]
MAGKIQAAWHAVNDAGRAEDVIDAGADFIAPGRGGLANHDWSARVRAGEAVREFDREILAPIADIKDSELPAVV